MNAAAHGWGWAETIAFGGLLVMVISIAGGTILHAVKTAYKFGEHAQRMKQAEEHIKGLQESEDKAEAYRTEMAVLRTLVTGMQGELKGFGEAVTKRIEQLDHDLRNLLTGRVKPATRTRDGD
jgi:hypothetical protein